LGILIVTGPIGVDNATKNGGIGLGLILIRDSLKKMKRKLKIESKRGKGTKFTIRLLLAE